MSATVNEWIAKAQADFAVAGRELAVTVDPSFDAVCFHAQQCIEKLMKALLIRIGVTPPRVHDLNELSRLLTTAYPGWSWPD